MILAHEFISHSAASARYPGPLPAIQTLLMQLYPNEAPHEALPYFLPLLCTSSFHSPSRLSPVFKIFSATVSPSGDSLLSLIILRVSLICLLGHKLMGN